MRSNYSVDADKYMLTANYWLKADCERICPKRPKRILSGKYLTSDKSDSYRSPSAGRPRPAGNAAGRARRRRRARLSDANVPEAL